MAMFLLSASSCTTASSSPLSLFDIVKFWFLLIKESGQVWLLRVMRRRLTIEEATACSRLRALLAAINLSFISFILSSQPSKITVIRFFCFSIYLFCVSVKNSFDQSPFVFQTTPYSWPLFGCWWCLEFSLNFFCIILLLLNKFFQKLAIHFFSKIQ